MHLFTLHCFPMCFIGYVFETLINIELLVLFVKSIQKEKLK